MTTDQLPGGASQEGARRERRWQWGILGATGLAALLGMSLFGLLLHASGYLWLFEGAYVVLLLLVMGVTVALIRWRRRRGSRAFAQSPLWEVGFRERNQIVRAIRRDRPVAPEHRDLALRTARHIVSRGSWLIWMYVVVSVLFVVTGVLNSGLGRVFDIVAACLFLVMAGTLGWNLRRAGEYVRRHLVNPTIPAG
jgi:MFS family permease